MVIVYFSAYVGDQVKHSLPPPVRHSMLSKEQMRLNTEMLTDRALSYRSVLNAIGSSGR